MCPSRERRSGPSVDAEVLAQVDAALPERGGRRVDDDAAAVDSRPRRQGGEPREQVQGLEDEVAGIGG